LDSPFANVFPVLMPAVHRIAELNRNLNEVRQEVRLLRQDMISTRSRSKSAGSMSATLLMVEGRRAEEIDILESISARWGSSPPQGRND
jgi:hypothetical protein